MKYISNEWSEKHKKLGKAIRKSNDFSKAMDLFLGLHSQLHMSIASGNKYPNEIDLLFLI